jgi:hypothetical protein
MASGYPNSACDDAKLQRMGSDPAGLTPWHNLAIRPSNLICPAIVQASRYIHRNPVEAGLVAEPWQWPWSSAQAYLGLVRTPAWLHTEKILEMLGPHDARRRYRELLGEEIGAATQPVHGEVVPWGQTRRV